MSVTFAYRARKPSGEAVRGTMRALDRPTALAALRERMLIPSSLEAKTTAYSFGRMFARSKPAERLAFFRAYAALEASGVDFSTSFGLLIAQARTPRMKEALSNIKADVEQAGEKLWAAMSHRPDEFTDLEVAMIAAGEEAGNREEVFDRLATFLERDEKLRKRLRAALFYPSLVVGAACLITIYLFTIVIPQFARLFTTFDVPLSPIMVALTNLTNAVSSPVAIATLAGTAGFAVIATSRTLATPEGALAFDALRFRLPVLGDAMRKSIVARLCRVLATLLQSGVNQMRALEVSLPVAESPLFANAIERARERIANGRAASLEEALGESRQFPPLMLGFIGIGATAGTIPAMLFKIAEYYEEDVESVLTALPAAIQTVVTLGLGAVVATIVYIVYVPLTTLSSSIH